MGWINVLQNEADFTKRFREAAICNQASSAHFCPPTTLVTLPTYLVVAKIGLKFGHYLIHQIRIWRPGPNIRLSRNFLSSAPGSPVPTPCTRIDHIIRDDCRVSCCH